MFIIGERINSSRKSILRAIEKKDSKFIQEEAVRQVCAGAAILDVNAGTMQEKEVASLEWLIHTVQAVTEVPLSIDSPNPEAIEAGLRVHRGKAMVNSVTGEEARAKAILPLVKKYQTSLVALTMNDQGMPEASEERIAIAQNILTLAKSYDIPPADIYFDPLIRPIGTDVKQGLAILEAIKGIMSWGEDVHTICGLSNISYGLPERKLLNKTFLSLAIASGLDAVILDPLDQRLLATLVATEALLGKDEFCMRYINASREGQLGI